MDMSIEEIREATDITHCEADAALENHSCTLKEFLSENPKWDGSGEELLDYLGY